MRRNGFLRIITVVAGVLAALFGLSQTVSAQSNGDFSLQVTPSPIVSLVKPGVPTEVEIKIRNRGTAAENLTIKPRKFSIDDGTGKPLISNTEEPEAAQWISFSSPTFTVKPGEWFTQKVRIALPKDTGFSYSLALMISRATDPKVTSGQALSGSVAIFTLINVDRPGATRQLEIESVESEKGVYEYLPAKINVRFKNTGNTIIKPYGDVFITQGGEDSKPLASMPVNAKKGYILPGSSRVLEAEWADGFPRFETTIAADSTSRTTENWDFSKLQNLRIGQYTAKVVGAYNDGSRDVSIEKSVNFWVFPWKIVLIGLIVLTIMGLGIWVVVRSVWRMTHGGGRRHGRMRF